MRIRTHSPLATRSRRRPNLAPRFDSLESRQLLTVSVVENPLPALSNGYASQPRLIARTTDGAVWTISGSNYSSGTNIVQRADAAGLTSEVSGITTTDPIVALFPADSGSVWAVSTPSYSYYGGSGTAHVYKLNPNYSSAGSLPTGVSEACLGPDGDIWALGYTTSNYTTSYSIEKFDPATGVVTTYPAPTPTSTLRGLLSGPDGNLWFGAYDASGGSAIAKITTSGRITKYATADQEQPVAVSSDGNIWIAGQGAISEITTSGVITPVTDLGILYPYSAPNSFAPAPDGSLWFLAPWRDGVGRVGHDGSIAYTPLPSNGSGTNRIIGDGGTGFYVSQTNAVDHLLTDAAEPDISLKVNSINQNEGSLPAGVTLASFTAADTAAVAADFVAVVYIEGQSGHYVPVTSDGSGGFVITTPGGWYDQETPGAYLMTVAIIDAKHGNTVGAKSSGLGVATFIDPPIVVTGRTFTAYMGLPYSYGVATLYDPGTGYSSYVNGITTIDWGDGSPVSMATDVYRDGNYSQYDGVGQQYPGHTYAAKGTYAVTIREDHGGIISTGTSTAVVTDPPPISQAGWLWHQPALGQPFSDWVAYFTAQNPSATAADFTADIDWGDGTTSAGTISRQEWSNYVQFNVSGSHTYTKAANFDTVVTIRPVGYPASAAKVVPFTAYVYDAGASTAAATDYAIAGRDSEIQVASFDLNNQSQASTADFTAAIDWGDGSTGFGDVMGGPTHFTVWGRHTFTSAGMDAVKTIVNRSGSNITTNTTTNVDVASPLKALAAIPAATAGRTVSGDLASFTPGAVGAISSYRASIDWGDGTTSPGSIAASGTHEVVSGSHTYANGGNYTRIVTIQYGDAIAGSAVSTSTAKVAAIATIAPERAGLSQGVAGRVRVASFTTTDPTETAADYAATVSWGGAAATIAEIVAASGGGFDVFSTYTPKDWGDVTATVIVTANGGGPASIASDVLVTPAPISATISFPGTTLYADAGSPFGTAVATFRSSNPNAAPADFSATIDWGDGTTSAGTIRRDDVAGFLIGGSHTYATTGRGKVTVTIGDLGVGGQKAIGARVAGDFWVTSEPVIVVPPPNITLQGSTTLSGATGSAISGVVVTIHDGSPGPASQYAATIDWGDGATSAGTISTYQGSLIVFGSHVYTTAGVHPYGVIVLKSGTTSVTTTGLVTVSNPVVVGTPGSGGVTGGGPIVVITPTSIVATRMVRTRKGAAQVVANLAGSIDPAKASDGGHYVLTEAGKDGKFGTKDDRSVKVGSVQYNAATHAVTLTPKGTFAKTPRFRVTWRA